MPRPHFGGERRAGRGQEDATIEFGGGEAFALQPRDALDGGGVRDAEPAGDVGGPGFAFGAQQVVDQLDIVFEDRRRLRRAGFAETLGLIGLGRQNRLFLRCTNGLRGHLIPLCQPNARRLPGSNANINPGEI